MTEEEFKALQDVLSARSNGIHPKRRGTSLLIGVAHCAGWPHVLRRAEGPQLRRLRLPRRCPRHDLSRPRRDPR
ncbi:MULTISPECIES: hypothetical protein [Streptomyces]|uniref:hypothetical protein n=1 Tax=Streptomyces TaxID=1883 RepID=UPI001ABF3F63|nr:MULTISPECIES: hypothetical protein [Streptomyces]MDI5906174.1 hypothetical protein [Streptomyces sp. 12257]